MSILVRGLQKSFSSRRQGVKAVDDLSLEVEDGELLVILGPSGSGKTTLLRCIAGLERADAGTIVIDGRTVYSSEERIWVPPERRGVSMVFQSYALWPHMTVFANIAYPLRTRGTPKQQVRERVMTALEMVGCGHLAQRHPNEISGGQQQRVAVARAIVGGARVVLFDEPLSAVDARVREDLRHELVALQRDLGFASVYITHDQTEAMAIGHRVAVLADGTIKQLARPRELYGRPVSTEVASFMGATNQFSGPVVRRPAGTWTVRSELGPVTVSPDDAPSGDADATLIIRPEHWRITATRPATDDNVWPAVIESSVFLGYCTEYRVRVADDRTVTVRSDDPAPLEGDVWLHVPPSGVRVVQGPAAIR